MSEYPVFVPTKSETDPYAGYPIGFIVGHGPQIPEDIGIEIEVEGNKFPKTGPQYGNGGEEYLPIQWKYTHDGSLRGDDNAEYVLRAPIKFDDVPKAISDLWGMFDRYGSVLEESNRTSVHVHLNVQGFHLNRLAAFCGMYFALEDILTHWCGEHRVGNLFCMRAKDAPATVTHLKRFIQDNGRYSFPNGLHYAGLNPGAITKFGSVEIRALRGVSDPKVILDWIAVLRRLYELSAEFPDPRAVVAGFSGEGPISWLERMLGDKCGTILNECPYNTDEIRNSLYEGIRLAQDLCYCREWSEYTPVTPEVDPFGRMPRAGLSPPPTSMSAYQLYVDTHTGNTGSGAVAITPATWATFSPSEPEEDDMDMEDYEPEEDYDDE